MKLYSSISRRQTGYCYSVLGSLHFPYSGINKSHSVFRTNKLVRSFMWNEKHDFSHIGVLKRS